MTLTQKPPTKLQKKTKTSCSLINDSGLIQVEYKTQTDDTLFQFYKFISIDNFRTSTESIRLISVINSFVFFIISDDKF